MVLEQAAKPIYLALFSLTLLAVMASSGAVMALVGQGHDVLVFSAGVGVGMSFVSALSLEQWHLLKARLLQMQLELLDTISAAQVGQINPQLLLSRYGRPLATPQNASDIEVEIECRRLLDRTHQLLGKAVSGDGYCRYCEGWHEHQDDCPVPAAQRLYDSGKAKRLPWREYKKTLPQDVS